MRDGLLVVTPIKDSPAYKAQMKAGDLITEIVKEVDRDGNPVAGTEVIDTKELRVDEAVKKILGKAGTRVKLKVTREGEAKPVEFVITRGPVSVETVWATSARPTTRGTS